MSRRRQLRPYQVTAVGELVRRFKRHRRIVAVGPTASGKTTIGVALIKRYPGKRVLWVAHRIELLDQARAEVIAAGIPADEISLFGVAESGARVIVASIQMLARKSSEAKRLVPKADIIVIDEAHRVAASSYQAVIDARPKALVLGLTATPKRLDGQALADTFDDMLVFAESVELIADGHIAQPICYGLPLEKALALTRGIKVKKDFADRPLGRAMARRALVGDLVTECGRLALGLPTIVFAVNREHGRALLRRFLAAGRSAEYLDGETPSTERAAMLARLRGGETEVIVNVDVLSEGFDCPPVKCIVLARPTKSLTRFLQQVGRGNRAYKGRRPIVLDHAGNCWRFGLPEEPREWDLAGREPSTTVAVPPARHCPTCSRVVAIGCLVCPGCGADLPRADREIEEHAAELQRIRRGAEDRAALEGKLCALAAARGLGRDWVDHALKAVS